MAIDLYESTENPVSGETFRCLNVSPEAYTMLWSLKADGYVPFEHIHFHQDEIFEVQKGELKVIIDGTPYIVSAGQQITVPKGSRHIASNNRNEVMEATVSYIPALDYDKFMQCLCGLTKDGHIDKMGGIKVPMMGYFLKKMKCKAMSRPTNIPAPAFSMALNVFYIMGSIRGWKRHYKNYTS